MATPRAQVFDHLFGDAHADDFLRFFGRAADVRRSHHGIEREQRHAGRRRFRGEDIQSGTGDFAAGNGFGERGIVHQFAAGAVHNAHAGLHLRESFAGKQTVSFGRDRHVQSDVIRLAIKLGQFHQLDAQIARDLRSHIGIAGHDAHFKSARAFHDFAADAAQPDDAQRLAAQLAAQKFLLLPLAAFGGRGGLRNMARHGQHQGEGVLRHRGRIAAGRIHDQNAGGGGGGQIHVVHAHASASDDAQLGRFGQHFSGHLHGAADNQRVGIRQVLRIFLGIGNDRVPAGLRLK